MRQLHISKKDFTYWSGKTCSLVKVGVGVGLDALEEVAIWEGRHPLFIHHDKYCSSYL